jgi:hypothetical protein
MPGRRDGEGGRRRAALALVLLASGCARRHEAPPPSSPTSSERLFNDASVESKLGGAGGSIKSPVPRCGPRDSYYYVASEFRCPGGGNPLDGDVGAAARVRSGSVGPDARGHMIDVYEVPCPSGKVDVFVDMYACEEMEKQLARDVAVPDPQQLDVKFSAGEYDEVRARCDALGDDAPGMTQFHCGVFGPALWIRAGDVDRAVATAARTCRSYPPVSARSKIRVEIAVAMVDAIARMWAADQVPAKEGGERLSRLLPRLLQACEVDAATFMTEFEAAVE